MWTPVFEIKQLANLMSGATKQVAEEAAKVSAGNGTSIARIILELAIMLLWVVLVFIVGIGGTIFWVLMMIDCANRKFKKSDEKLMWLIIVIASYLIGALIYYFVIKKKGQ
jgi:ABC-type Fe3+-siderophore transport system permease subunit